MNIQNISAGWYKSKEFENEYQYWSGSNWEKYRLPLIGQDPREIPKPIHKTFRESVSHSLRGTLRFRGRSSLREMWLFNVFHFVGTFILITFFPDPPMNLIAGAWLWGFMPTQISIHIRRCHDLNMRGWMLFVPFVNFIVSVSRGNPLENRFGVPDWQVNSDSQKQ
jgi:uncharacterized membrane protein YhaH (DUF805 family)